MAPALRVEAFVVGFCVLALGVLWTLANLDILELLPTLRTWWPASLVVWGLAELANTYLSRSAKGPSR
jgi:hypothetical protein